MKILPLLGVLFLSGMCASSDTESREPVTFRNLQAAAYGSSTVGDAAHVTLVTDEASFRSVWSSNIGDPPPSEIDFSKESVVFLFAGQRPTGGYSVEAKGVSISGEAVIVDAEVKSPPARAMVTQVITYPFAVIAVSKPNLTRAEWRGRDGRLVTEHTRQR